MSQVEDFNLAKALREKLREVEDRLARNANRSPVSRADEQEMTAMQARVDAVYVKAGRKAPPPLPYERPGQFRRRLAQGLVEYSPKLQGVDLAALADVKALPLGYLDVSGWRAIVWLLCKGTEKGGRMKEARMLEIEPDAWERFERAVDTVSKSEPQLKAKDKSRRNNVSRSPRKGHFRCDKKVDI